jgi:hypothetical protein
VAVALRSSSQTGASDTNGSSCTVPVPAGAAAGDIALLVMEQWETFDATSVTFPAGFTVVVNALLSGAREKLFVGWKRLTGADTGNYVITWTGAQWNMGHCLLITGAVATGDPVEASNTATGTGTTIPGTSVTTVTQPFLAHLVANEDAATGTPPTSFTEARDGDYLKTNYRIPGATGTHTVSGGSTSASSAKSVALIAIQAASTGGSVSGTADAPLGALVATATGVRTVVGTATAPLGGLSATASGTPTVLATASAAFGVLVATASGSVLVVATAAAPFGALTAAATGGHLQAGTADAACGALVASASGSTATTGTAAAPLGALTASATGTVGVTATAAATFGALTATAAGAVTVPATASAVLGALVASASGTVTPVGGGSAAATFGALTATATGVVTVSATAAAVLGALTASASGTRATSAAAAALLGGLVASATGARFTTGTAVALLGALVAGAVVTPPITRGGSYRLTRAAAAATPVSRGATGAGLLGRTTANGSLLDRRASSSKGGT